ncbi:MAG: extracellular solute-binding protein [Ardenticatenaceae bacterium]|nr:extracellular solute-binding protein [Ardenticatenaceae bacterium]
MSTCRVPPLLALLLVPALLVACGPRPTLPAAAQPFVLEEIPPTPTPAGRPLRVLAPYVDEEAARFRKVLDDFTASSGVQVQFTGAPEVPGALLQALEADQPPDVVVIPKPNWLGELAGAGVLAPLRAEVTAAVRGNYSAGWQELASHDGTLYGVPLNTTSKSLVWYRPAAVMAVGSSVPRTWDEWLALNRTLAAAGPTPLAVPGGEGWPLTDWFENVLLRTAGPETYDKLTRHEVPWTDPAVRTTFQEVGQMLRDEWLAGGRPGAAGAPLAETLAAAFDPEHPAATMVLGAGWVGPFVRAKHPGVILGRDLDFFSFPTIARAFSGAVEGYANTAVALNARPETMALLAFLASPEAAARWVRQGGVVSPNKSLALSAYPDDLTRREAAHLADARIFVPDLSDTVPRAVSDALAAGLQHFLREPAALDTILTEIEAAAERTQG